VRAPKIITRGGCTYKGRCSWWRYSIFHIHNCSVVWVLARVWNICDATTPLSISISRLDRNQVCSFLGMHPQQKLYQPPSNKSFATPWLTHALDAPEQLQSHTHTTTKTLQPSSHPLFRSMLGHLAPTGTCPSFCCTSSPNAICCTLQCYQHPAQEGGG
jgi:hypothetical protein